MAAAAAALAAALAPLLGPLLTAYWVLAAGSVVATLLPLPLPQAFKDAVALSAARGKLWQTKPDALGPLRDWAVPQRWFLHFYVVGAACNAAALAALACGCCGGGSGRGGSAAAAAVAAVDAATARALLALALFEAHLLRRALETAFVMRYPPGARMHGIAYLFGLSYYVAVPLSLLPPGRLAALPAALLAAPKAAAAALPARGLGACAAGARAAVLSLLQQRGPWVAALAVAGAVVFIAGNALQAASHAALAALAPAAGAARSERTAYRIPKGPLFALVSCPHYLAEIVIYAGLALLTAGSTNALLMLFWVAVNLALAARATQAWYRARFKGSYPATRRALIPYLF